MIFPPVRVLAPITRWISNLISSPAKHLGPGVVTVELLPCLNFFFARWGQTFACLNQYYSVLLIIYGYEWLLCNIKQLINFLFSKTWICFIYRAGQKFSIKMHFWRKKGLFSKHSILGKEMSCWQFLCFSRTPHFLAIKGQNLWV